MPDYGTYIPAPHWYPAYLPKFYRQSSGAIFLRPINSYSKYIENDVLDCLLYLQTIIGYNRIDTVTSNGIPSGNYSNVSSYSANYSSSSPASSAVTNDSYYHWVVSAFKQDSFGDGGGDFTRGKASGFFTIDNKLLTDLKNRYIANEKSTMPWLSSLNTKGRGIDLMSIPMSTDIEIPRPSWYPRHLPSLFTSTGQPYQHPAGSMDTKPKIDTYQTKGVSDYTITPNDVAELMLYAQPVVYAGPSPYPINWYINDQVNGAMAMRFKISLGFKSGFNNAQEQGWGMAGDIMKAPVLDANPYASGFSQTMEGIIKYVISYFTGKIPGAASLTTVAKTAASLGGAGITGSDAPPAGAFSAAVFKEADRISAAMKKANTTKDVLLIALAAIGIGWWAHDEGYF